MILTHISYDKETKSGLYDTLCQYNDISKIWLITLNKYENGKNIPLKSRITNDKKKALNTYHYYKRCINNL